MKINGDFDSGNIECISCEHPDNIRLRIRADNASKELQWFHFELSGGPHTAEGQREEPYRLVIENAGDCAYKGGYVDYQACASYDGETWFRVPTSFDGTQMVIEHLPAHDPVSYAYFAPYPLARHQAFVERLQQVEGLSYEKLCNSNDGHELGVFCLADVSTDKKNAWIIARQHPGETMAEWWMEGFFARLLDDDDAIAQSLKARYNFYVVINMNPDGSQRGNLRTNSRGRDLNRAWLEPCMDETPEVFYVLDKMRDTGVDFFLDVHGDEELPYNFVAGAEGTPSWNDARQAQLDAYTHRLAEINPAFQTKVGYPLNPPGEADMRIATHFMAEEFQCLAMTLEMPFKDDANNPLPDEGWSPRRCRTLAESCMEAMLDIYPQL
jgi:murein tripeptide amidase MpaA